MEEEDGGLRNPDYILSASQNSQAVESSTSRWRDMRGQFKKGLVRSLNIILGLSRAIRKF